MDVILSIKPIHVDAIKSGVKRYEFRKVIFRKVVEGVYIYSTSPVKKVTGYFKVGRIVEDHPIRLWELLHKYAGVSKSEFFSYYGNSQKGFAIEIKDPVFFNLGIDPRDFTPKFSPPQSLRYVEHIDLKDLSIIEKRGR